MRAAAPRDRRSRTGAAATARPVARPHREARVPEHGDRHGGRSTLARELPPVPGVEREQHGDLEEQPPPPPPNNPGHESGGDEEPDGHERDMVVEEPPVHAANGS